MSSGTATHPVRNKETCMKLVRQGVLNWNDVYDVLTEDELDRLVQSIHEEMYPPRRSAKMIAARVEELLNMGYGTEEIAKEVGSQYQTFLYSFKRIGGHEELRQRLIALRAREYEERTRYAA